MKEDDKKPYELETQSDPLGRLTEENTKKLAGLFRQLWDVEEDAKAMRASINEAIADIRDKSGLDGDTIKRAMSDLKLSYTKLQTYISKEALVEAIQTIESNSKEARDKRERDSIRETKRETMK